MEPNITAILLEGCLSYLPQQLCGLLFVGLTTFQIYVGSMA
jgi:hypothetical protein